MAKHCILSVLGNNKDNANADSDNTVFTIKDAKLYVPFDTLSAKDNETLSKLFTKGFERSVYWTKSENKITANEYRCFLESNFVVVKILFVLIYQSQDGSAKRFNCKKYY